jgi:hypothetical protein
VARLPAIPDDNELHQFEGVFGQQSFGRKEGEALHPAREPPEMLEQIGRTIGEYNFAGQYQQMPAPQGGGMVKAAWFRTYAPNERPERFGIEARGLRAGRSLQCQCRADRGQGLGHLADLGTGRAGPACGHPLPAASRQDHAHAHPDRDDRERLSSPAQGGRLASRIPIRAVGVPQRQARRPGRFDLPAGSTGSSRPAASPAASTSITRSSPGRRRPSGPSHYR